MTTTGVRERARKLIEQLPSDATWEDLQYRIFVRQTIEAGLEDCEAGRLVSTEDVRKRLGLPS